MEIITTRDALAVWAGLETSLTWTLIVNVPVFTGLPLITPLAVLRLRPWGSPEADQAYGGVPPLAVRVTE